MEDEDPSVRRKYWQTFYDKFADTDRSIVNERIIASFHDIWSEIRYDNAKGLCRLIHQLSQSQIASLMEAFMVYISPSSVPISWQVIHGSLLGIIVLMEPYFSKNDSTELVRDKVLQSSVLLLAHMNLLVRESSRKCINTYINIGNSAYNNKFIISLLKNIYEKVLQDKSCNNEISANALHGMLGCVIDYVKTNLISIHRYNISGDITLLSILNLCLSHKSSTVRLRSVEVISALFAKLMSDKNTNEMTELLEFMSNLILTSSVTASSWEIIESALLICEELMNNAVRNIIQFWLQLSEVKTVNSDDAADIFTSVYRSHSTYSLDAFRVLVSCLRNNLAGVLLHSQFEVRRMACQLLPSLVRVCILLDYDLDMNIQYPETTRDGGVGGVESNLRSMALHNAVAYSWTSEVAKSVQNLIEVFELTIETSSLKALERDVDCTPLEVPILAWVMKIKGRLSEEEMKILFNNLLKLLYSSGSKSVLSLVRYIMYKALTRLSRLADQVIAVESSMIQLCTQLDVNFVNVDYIEAICLTWCVFIPYKKQINKVSATWTALFDIASVQIHSLETAFAYIINQLQKIQVQTQGNTDLVVSSLLGQTTGKYLGDVESVFPFGSDVGVAAQAKSPPTSPTKKVYYEYNASDRLQIISSITDPNSAKVTETGSSGILALCCVDSIGCNRWICEAIAPLHPLISCSVCHELTECITIDLLSQYGRILVNWIVNCTIDVLWLDRKLSAKKAMYEGLHNVVAGIMRFSSSYKNIYSPSNGSQRRAEVGTSTASKRLINLSIDTTNSSINYKNTSSNIERILTNLFHVITLQAGMGGGSSMDAIDAFKLVRSYNLLLTSTTFVSSPVNAHCSSYVYNKELAVVILQQYKKKFGVTRTDIPVSISSGNAVDSTTLSTVSNGADTEGSREGSDLDEAEFSDWDNDDNDELEGSAVSIDKRSVQSGGPHHNHEVNVKINAEIDEILRILHV